MLIDHNYNACLTDFGCASLVGELPEGFTYLKMSTMRPGTLRWAAPEHFSLNEEETKHTIKNDIYSFGNIALLVRTEQLFLELCITVTLLSDTLRKIPVVRSPSRCYYRATFVPGSQACSAAHATDR